MSKNLGPRVVAVVACPPGGVIGRDGGMPWRLSSDLQRFKRMTMGGTLLMGRRTYQSIGRPLPGRRTLVLTRDPDWSAPGVDVVHDNSHVLPRVRTADLFIVGGGEIYRQWWDRCDELWWTCIHADVDGDTRVDLPLDRFKIVERLSVPMTVRDDYPTQWQRRVAA